MTRTYPFRYETPASFLISVNSKRLSSECIDEAKRRVHQDPASNRSWNYCWLVLSKIQKDGLISSYARAQANRPEMWGGLVPGSSTVEQLAQAFAKEWSAALAQLLRYWDVAPMR